LNFLLPAADAQALCGLTEFEPALGG
jgi:hypothetical protein